MKYAFVIARVLLGLVFTVFGLNAFLHFFPSPPVPGLAGQFMGALLGSHYYVIAFGTELIGGALLLSNCYVPLALTVLAPVVVNIVAFHLFLAPSGLAIPIVVLALGVFLAWSYRAAFKPMLRADVSPDTATERAASRTARAA